jgi:misacylated tRNA(Ala) deacylase
MTGTRLYLDDPYLREFDAEVVDSVDGWWTLSATAFYPGGGGQPPDRGRLDVPGATLDVPDVREDDGGRVWHRVGRGARRGEPVHGVIDWPFRHALMRQHGLMHLVNTVALRRFGGAITGVQLAPDRSRIDFRLREFAREQIVEFEAHVNAVIERALPITSSVIDEAEYRARPDLVRTLNVRPPVVDGTVRVVTIAGFDAQACGGTHVHSTGEIGHARVVRFDNKGKDNKRFYWAMR